MKRRSLLSMMLAALGVPAVRARQPGIPRYGCRVVSPEGAPLVCWESRSEPWNVHDALLFKVRSMREACRWMPAGPDGAAWTRAGLVDAVCGRQGAPGSVREVPGDDCMVVVAPDVLGYAESVAGSAIDMHAVPTFGVWTTTRRDVRLLGVCLAVGDELPRGTVVLMARGNMALPPRVGFYELSYVEHPIDPLALRFRA